MLRSRRSAGPRNGLRTSRADPIRKIAQERFGHPHQPRGFISFHLFRQAGLPSVPAGSPESASSGPALARCAPPKIVPGPWRPPKGRRGGRQGKEGAPANFVSLCPREGSGDCARRGGPRFPRPDPLSEMPGDNMRRDARVRLRPHQGAVGFVVPRFLALASQTILFFGVDCL